MIVPTQIDLFAVIGNPINHSLSPAMMNAAFRHLGIPATYVALRVDEPVKDLEILRETGFLGLSVTLPHKEFAYKIAGQMDENTKAIGAVNTLRRARNGWEGHNTDWIGANRALEAVTPVRGKRVLVIGAGGVARAVVFGLKRAKAEVVVSNRGLERGESLARDFGCEFIPLSELERLGSKAFEVIVQCTSVGMVGAGEGYLVPKSFFHRGMVVMDTVYRPLWTPFLVAAKEAECTVVSGIDMLLYQGVAQLEWWLEQTVTQDGVRVMNNALMGALSDERIDQGN